MCTNTVAPLPKMGIDGMPAPWSRMGMVYALLPFKMIPAVLNNIGSSHDLSVILVALVAHHGCQSYSSSLDVFPYHWKVIHFSHKKFECLEVTSRPLLTQEVWMPGSHIETSMCTNTAAPLPKMGIDEMPAPWSRMGMVYALLPFKMLPAVLNNIGSSHDLSVILVALVAHHGCQSYSSSLDVFPYHWKVIHFSHKKFECLGPLLLIWFNFNSSMDM